MKVYKLKELEYYTVAFSKGEAVTLFWKNNIGVTVDNIEETDITPNREAIGSVFKNLESMQEHGSFE